MNKVLEDAHFGHYWRIRAAAQINMMFPELECAPRVPRNLIKDIDFFNPNKDWHSLSSRFMEEGEDGSGLDYTLTHHQTRKKVNLMFRRGDDGLDLDSSIYWKLSSSKNFEVEVSLRKDYWFLFLNNKFKRTIPGKSGRSSLLPPLPSDKYLLIRFGELSARPDLKWVHAFGNRVDLFTRDGRIVSFSSHFKLIPFTGVKRLFLPLPSFEQALKNLFL